MRIFGQHKHHGTGDRQKEVKKLDIALSKLVRAYEESCITCGSTQEQCDNGHFRRRECMSTRFHPMNVHRQGVKENRFEGGKPFEYGLALDEKYGDGAALFLFNLSKETCQWSIEELQQLTSAAKMGYHPYCQLYYELRPHHRFVA